MKMSQWILALVLPIAMMGCSRAPVPAVAAAYASQYGAAQTSWMTPCPQMSGVWQLANLSGGSLQLPDGNTIQHFRWYAPQLFGFAIETKSYIALEERPVETVLYVADRMPLNSGSRATGYSVKTDKDMPCVGQGWRKMASIDHSLNDAAARVLGLVPELPTKITQVDYLARTSAHELLVATRIDFEGTNAAKEAVSSGYWHFLKMPRLHESAKAQGFKE